MGQQPNIDLEMADLPRPEHRPHAPRSWSAERPAELVSPSDVPWGGRFGTPGPDTGYALSLLAEREISTAGGESRGDAVAAISALMAARASHFGRAPVITDAVVAELMLGYHPDAPSGMAAARVAAITGLAHHPERARALLAGIDTDVLAAPVDEVRRRVSGGEAAVDFG